MYSTAQVNTIKGVVYDTEKNPLAGVNVYISGTIEGASTDSLGRFEFKTKLEGKFDLVASFLGFQSETREIRLSSENEYEFTFRLEENVFQLSEVQVSAKQDKEWQNLFEDFRRFFIGWDSFANEVEIKNPESIDFERFGSREVIVTFREPIVIDNYALGYKVTIENQKIIFNPYDHTGFWNVYPRFEELQLDASRRIRRKWERNRVNAYNGSSKHFLISLLNDDLKRDKFILLPRFNALEKVTDKNLIRSSFPTDWQNISNNFNVYKIRTVNFGVAYDPEYKRSGDISPNTDISSFRISNFFGVIVFDNYGNIFNSQEVIFLGPWSKDRFAKTLPLDFNE